MDRSKALPRGTPPMSTMSAIATGDSERSPPASGSLYASANESRPPRNSSTHAGRRPDCVVSSRGNPNERKAAMGRAPMAARSLRPLAKARWPTDAGECQSRRKWRPAMERSVVTANSSGRGRSRAQSSPMPSRTIPSPLRPARVRIWRIKSSSPGLSSLIEERVRFDRMH